MVGSPSLTCEIEPVGAAGSHNTAGIVSTAMRVANAIPTVGAHEPGMARRSICRPSHGVGYFALGVGAGRHETVTRALGSLCPSIGPQEVPQWGARHIVGCLQAFR